MGKIYTSADQLIGGTPLLELTHIEKAEGLSARILAKLEYLNPAGSVKDRIARAMIDDAEEKGRFRYLVAGRYTGGEVPEGMTLYEFPEMEWAKFLCRGSMPGALQSVNTKIFREWLPENPDYEIAMGANIEWYGEGDIWSPDYESAIWIPVKRR